jgi:hypothetical protein
MNNTRSLEPSTNEKYEVKWMTESLVIAAVPLFGYFLSYCFEYGYFSYFGIPKGFIKVEMVEVLNVFGISIFLYFFIVGLGDMYILNYRHFKYRLILERIYIGVFFVNGIWVFISKTPISLTIYLITIFFGLMFGLVFPLLTHKGTLHCSKPALRTDIKEYPDNWSLVEIMEHKYGLRIAPWILIAAIIFWGTMACGSIYAVNLNEFVVISSSPEMIVLRIYGNTAICTTFDPDTKIIGHQYTMVKIDEGNLKLENQRVGPLQTEQK